VELEFHKLNVGHKALAVRVRRLRERLASRDLLFQHDARDLHDLLLPRAARLLVGKTRLLIVPDGPLWELPFQALQDPAGRYVIESAAVSYAPSLTILRESLANPRRTSGLPTLLGIGKANFGAKGARPAVLMSDLAPLPEAERQVRQLSALYGPDRSAIHLGNDATEDRFKTEAPRHRIVHVASHGLFEETSPLYSSIVLSPGDAAAAQDGLLEAWELLDLKLDADLVILSACETGRGRIASGEGIVGTMWALFAAGAKATVATQWKVEASSTTELMVAFHRRLARGDGDKVDHLRDATLEVMRNPRYAHPFYWAPFVLVGDPF
jgi:CHAT domain-containing protein